MSVDHMAGMSRRTVLRAGAAAAAVTAAAPVVLGAAGPAAATGGDPPAVRELMAKIQRGMTDLLVPGVAVGVWYRGREYVRGFGVTDVDHPSPVDGDTAFRVASTSKTFTATALMRLVERGQVHLDAPVRRYLPELRTADPSVAARVTVRQLLNHTAGWMGDVFTDTGQGPDALARYVAALADAPQFTAPGTVFGYNNIAFGVAGRIIEVVTRRPYEDAMRALLLDPLGLRRSRFFPQEFHWVNVSAPHVVDDGRPVAVPEAFTVPRGLNPVGGLISSAREQLRYARFHLDNGGRTGILDPATVRAMRSRPGPGGTLFVELDGVGVSWMLRPTAQGVTVVQHGGDWPGQHSGFLFVPERDFAITILTNCETGPALLADYFVDDWALRRFAGISNLPATPRRLPAAGLAAYEGTYELQQIGFDGALEILAVDVTGVDGHLALQFEGEDLGQLLFYRKDYVLSADPAGRPDGSRANFVRDASGQVAWLRLGGRLLRHGPAAVAARSAVRRRALPMRLPI